MNKDNNRRGKIYIDMENIMARFLHSYNANSLLFIANELLVREDNITVLLENDDLNCTGYSDIQNELKNLEIKKKNRDEYEISLCSSPYYKADDAQLYGEMQCDLYTYRIYQEKNSHGKQCELMISKLDVRFCYVKEDIKISHLEWKTIQSMVPWNYKESQSVSLNSKFLYPTLLTKKQSSNEDIIKIRNLQNYFFERKMVDVSHLFSKKETTSLYIEPISKKEYIGHDHIMKQIDQWLTKERNNQGYYSLLGITSAPIIEVNEEKQTAEGEFLIETFQLSEEWDQYTNQKFYPLERRLCYLKSSYLMEEGCWKILSMKMETIAELPTINYVDGKRYDRMSGYPNDWNLDNKQSKVNDINATYLIETILNRWVYNCRAGKLVQFYENYMKNSAVNCCMLIRSQGGKSKSLCTEEEIRERLSGMDRQHHNLMFSYHTATTPIIEFSEDGLSAKGTWFDHSATNLLSEATTKEKIPYMIFVAKYVHEFHKIEGLWKLTNFYWEPLISLPDWEYNSVCSKGFVTKENVNSLPNPYAY